MAIVLINEIPTEVGSGADEILRLREELKVLYATNNNHVEVRVKLREELAAWKEGHTKEKLSAIEWAGKCQELQEQLATLKEDVTGGLILMLGGLLTSAGVLVWLWRVMP